MVQGRRRGNVHRTIQYRRSDPRTLLSQQKTESRLGTRAIDTYLARDNSRYFPVGERSPVRDHSLPQTKGSKHNGVASSKRTTQNARDRRDKAPSQDRQARGQASGKRSQDGLPAEATSGTGEGTIGR